MNYRPIFAAGAMLLTAGVTLSPAHADDKISDLDKMFAVTVSQGNNAEVSASRLALKKSTSKKVRMIATTLIKQHGAAEDSLQRVAKTQKIILPPGTDSAHVAAYKKLESLAGSEFDKQYIADNVTDHYNTIGLFKKELANGTDSEMRGFATRYLPDIQNHTTMITAVASNYHLPVATKDAGRAESMKMGKMGK